MCDKYQLRLNKLAWICQDLQIWNKHIAKVLPLTRYHFLANALIAYRLPPLPLRCCVPQPQQASI